MLANAALTFLEVDKLFAQCRSQNLLPWRFVLFKRVAELDKELASQEDFFKEQKQRREKELAESKKTYDFYLMLLTF